MESFCRRAVQLTFRSTYNLVFEAFHRPGQEEQLCDDTEAYTNTALFQQTCQDLITMYYRAKTKSYSVWEEIRASGFTILECLSSVRTKVCWFQVVHCFPLNCYLFFFKAMEYLESNPILWVSSQIFCSFIIWRIEELRFIQVCFFKEPWSTYGIMINIIIHLLHNVYFSILAMYPDLIEALRDMSYEGIIQHFGMFFLQDLNPVTREIPVISQTNGTDLQNKLAMHVRKLHKNRVFDIIYMYKWDEYKQEILRRPTRNSRTIEQMNWVNTSSKLMDTLSYAQGYQIIVDTLYHN